VKLPLPIDEAAAWVYDENSPEMQL